MCGRVNTWTRGLFCANFSSSVNAWSQCLGTWCASCYITDPGLDFHIHDFRNKTRANENDPTSTSDEDRLGNLWKTKERDKKAFRQARPGDHLLVTFQCDLCIFRKLRRQECPIQGNPVDANLLACIRRVNLDAFWSRASSTVAAQRRLIERSLDLTNQLGLDPLFPNQGPLPQGDHCGYTVAIQMVYASISSGRYSESHLEFDTIRRLRTIHTNYFRTLGRGSGSVLAMVGEDGRSRRFTTDPTASEWFTQFLQGCKRRMGQDWRPDQAVSSELMGELLREVDSRISSSSSLQEAANWVTAGAYFVSCYVLSLRGSEGLLIDLGGLKDYLTRDPPERVTVTLLGKVKGEHHVRHHVLPAVSVTSSGLPIKSWIKKLVAVRSREGRRDGPAVCGPNGEVLETSMLNDLFHEALIAIYERQPGLFLADIKGPEDIESKYNVFRSFRRGSDTRAISQAVAKLDIEVVNRWKGMERSKGSRPNMTMEQHYADVNFLTESFLRYTRAM